MSDIAFTSGRIAPGWQLSCTFARLYCLPLSARVWPYRQPQVSPLLSGRFLLIALAVTLAMTVVLGLLFSTQI
jgi:hypothetical protein